MTFEELALKEKGIKLFDDKKNCRYFVGFNVAGDMAVTEDEDGKLESWYEDEIVLWFSKLHAVVVDPLNVEIHVNKEVKESFSFDFNTIPDNTTSVNLYNITGETDEYTYRIEIHTICDLVKIK